MTRAELVGIGDDALGLETGDATAEMILGADASTNLKNGLMVVHSPKLDASLPNRKPCGAPKRFKSSFIFFSMEKHKEIKDQMQNKDASSPSMQDLLGKGEGDKVSPPPSKNITKMVSEAWRSLTPEEKKKYEDMAARDKVRYDQESATFKREKGPNALRKKRPKDPNLPKRPMSAFLAFANSRRAETKATYPESTNGEISKLLSGKWKEMSESVKQKYKQEEATLWATYKEQMADYRKKNDGRKKNKTMDFQKVKVSKPKKKAKTSSATKKSHSRGVKNSEGFDDDSLSNESFDVPNFGSFGAQGMEPGMNANQDDIMAASVALRGVRSSGPNANMIQLGGFGGVGGGIFGNGGGSGPASAGLAGGMDGSGIMGLDLGGLQQNFSQGGGNGTSLGALLGNNPMASISGALSNSNGNSQRNDFGQSSGMGQDFGSQASPNRSLIDMGFPFQQYGPLLGNNSQAMLMAQAAALRPGGLLGFGDQQQQLSHLASLAGGQNGMGGLGSPAPGGMPGGLNLGNFGLGGFGGGFGSNNGGGLNANGLMNDNSNNRFGPDGAASSNF